MIPPCTPEWSTKEPMVKRTRALKTVSGRSEVAISLASRGRLAIITMHSSEGQVKPGIETLEREYEEDKKTSTKAKWRQRNSPVWAIYRSHYRPAFYSTIEQRSTVSSNSTTQKPQVSQSCALKVQNMPKGGSKLCLPDLMGAGWPALQGPWPAGELRPVGSEVDRSVDGRLDSTGQV